MNEKALNKILVDAIYAIENTDVDDFGNKHFNLASQLERYSLAYDHIKRIATEAIKQFEDHHDDDCACAACEGKDEWMNKISLAHQYLFHAQVLLAEAVVRLADAPELWSFPLSRAERTIDKVNAELAEKLKDFSPPVIIDIVIKESDSE
jgi:hypothetical protein